MSPTLAISFAAAILGAAHFAYSRPLKGINLSAFRFEKPLTEVIVSLMRTTDIMLVFNLAIIDLPFILPFPEF